MGTSPTRLLSSWLFWRHLQGENTFGSFSFFFWHIFISFIFVSRTTRVCSYQVRARGTGKAWSPQSTCTTKTFAIAIRRRAARAAPTTAIAAMPSTSVTLTTTFSKATNSLSFSLSLYLHFNHLFQFWFSRRGCEFTARQRMSRLCGDIRLEFTSPHRLVRQPGTFYFIRFSFKKN